MMDKKLGLLLIYIFIISCGSTNSKNELDSWVGKPIDDYLMNKLHAPKEIVETNNGDKIYMFRTDERAGKYGVDTYCQWTLLVNQQGIIKKGISKGTYSEPCATY